jgi:hypothetical protein
MCGIAHTSQVCGRSELGIPAHRRILSQAVELDHQTSEINNKVQHQKRFSAGGMENDSHQEMNFVVAMMNLCVLLDHILEWRTLLL